MSETKVIDTADVVLHGPTKERWVVAYVKGDKVAWRGWPQGEANLSDCTLVEYATDEARVKLLNEMAAMNVQDERCPDCDSYRKDIRNFVGGTVCFPPQPCEHEWHDAPATAAPSEEPKHLTSCCSNSFHSRGRKASGTKEVMPNASIRTRPDVTGADRADNESELTALREENAKLRSMLFNSHACMGKYGDDGEMQCNRYHPIIDFKRDPIERLESSTLAHFLLRCNEAALATPETEGEKGMISMNRSMDESPWREIIDIVAKQLICIHEHKSGGNDYIQCDDCNLMWDYTKTNPKLAIKMFHHPLLIMLEQNRGKP